MNDDDQETSLLGKTYAIQLGIIKIIPYGATKHAGGAEKRSETDEERVNRVR